MSPVNRPQPQQDGENDLAILHPDREIVIGGETITVREYGFVEGVKLAPLGAPIVAALGTEFESKAGVSLAAMRNAFAAYPEQVVALIAASCDRDVAWVRALGDEEGDALLLLWQSVNAGFFVRRVASDFLVRRGTAQALAGAISTPPSSPTDTTRSSSAATRSVN